MQAKLKSNSLEESKDWQSLRLRKVSAKERQCICRWKVDCIINIELDNDRLL